MIKDPVVGWMSHQVIKDPVVGYWVIKDPVVGVPGDKGPSGEGTW